MTSILRARTSSLPSARRGWSVCWPNTGVHGYFCGAGRGGSPCPAQRAVRSWLTATPTLTLDHGLCAGASRALRLDVECDLAALSRASSPVGRAPRRAGRRRKKTTSILQNELPDREFGEPDDRVLIDGDLVRDYLAASSCRCSRKSRFRLGVSQPRCAGDMRAPEERHSTEIGRRMSIDPRLAPLMKLAVKGEREEGVIPWPFEEKDPAVSAKSPPRQPRQGHRTQPHPLPELRGRDGGAPGLPSVWTTAKGKESSSRPQRPSRPKVFGWSCFDGKGKRS